ncbi:MAG: helix-turn-helix domain-containing protein [Clostridia bacterium]|nr:helix-turn-helix domain-containing protein [Clostridia bacterium]
MFCDLILEHWEENVGPYWPYINLSRPYSLIYYVVSGTGTYTFDGKTYPFLKNHLYIFPPNKTISLDYDASDELRITFVHAYINPEPTQLIHLDTLEDSFLKHTIKLLRMYIKKPDAVYTRKLTEMLVSYIFEKYDAKSSSISREIKNYIEHNYLEVYKNSNLSSVFNYSNSHLLKIFKDDYNTTPRKYALKLLLQHIFSLLREGMPINQIATSLDFSSPENFSKFFKKNYGCSPSTISHSFNDKKHGE